MAGTETALAGLKVLDMSRILAGPSATQTLGDLGADVVKIETPYGGDDVRHWGPPFMRDANGQPMESAYFACCNRNKRSVALDFTKPRDLGILKQLVQRADILVENFKTGGLARFGLDYASLAAGHPRLIYCSITGFGQTGPYAQKAGYDFLMQGMGGLMSITGHPHGHPHAEPIKVGVAICDLFTGVQAVAAILAALHYRGRTGEGQYIDCALFDSQVAMLANQASSWLNCGIVPQPMGNHHPSIVPYSVYAVRDGHVIINCGNDAQFVRLCGVLGVPTWAEDVRFCTNAARCAHRDVLNDLLSARVKGLQATEVISLLEGAQVPCGPIHDIEAVFAHEQARARGVQVTLNREGGGEDGEAGGGVFSSVAYPARLSKTPACYVHAPPRLGAHNGEVFRDWGIDQKSY